MTNPEFLRELELTQEQFDALPSSVKKYLCQHDRSDTALWSLKLKPAQAQESVPRAVRRPQTEWNASHINMMMTRFQSAMEMDKKLG